MKHISILIISILLLSSPLFGNSKKGETLYKWKTDSGIQWREFGDKDIQAKYKGDVENGKPHGLGLIIFPDGAKYSGEWKNGKANGQGTFISPNGEQYQGGWFENRKHGFGESILADGFTFVGEWDYGRPWSGTHYDKDGNIVAKYLNGERQ